MSCTETNSIWLGVLRVAIVESGHTFGVDDGVANAVYKKIDASSIENRRTGNGFKRLDLNFKCLNWRTRKNNNTKTPKPQNPGFMNSHKIKLYLYN